MIRLETMYYCISLNFVFLNEICWKLWTIFPEKDTKQFPTNFPLLYPLKTENFRWKMINDIQWEMIFSLDPTNIWAGNFPVKEEWRLINLISFTIRSLPVVLNLKIQFSGKKNTLLRTRYSGFVSTSWENFRF